MVKSSRVALRRAPPQSGHGITLTSWPRIASGSAWSSDSMRRLDRDDRIARVDGALELMRAVDGHQVRHLADAQQGGDAGHQVLAESRRRTEDVGMTVRELRDLRGQHLRDGMRVGRVGHGQHPRHAVDLRGFGGNGIGLGRQHHDVDGAGRKRLRGRDAFRGRPIEHAVQVFGDDQDPGLCVVRHQINPFCLSSATSSAASFTITPLLRLGGGA